MKVSVAVALLAASALPSQQPREGSQAKGSERFGPGAEPVDRWNPARDEAAVPAYGGTLTVHIESLPSNLNGMLQNTSIASAMRAELHEGLVQRDWESWKYVPDLASSWDVADTLVVHGKDGETRTLHGRVQERDDGYELVAQDDGNAAPQVFPRERVSALERGTVITFHLRSDVRWHDGQPFGADDVLFTWRIAANPDVHCDWARPFLKKIADAEELDEHTVRFTFGEQYFNTLGLFADDFCILPRHLYDLTDPRNPAHQADARPADCARWINENPHNTQWIGLGPYRLTSYSQQGVEAERFTGYFEPEHGGYVDRIHWRFIGNDDAAFQALLDGELDFTQRILADQYFGEATQQAAFTRRYCKGYFYLGSFNYIPWNMRRPILADVRVRKALAQAMDLEAFVQTVAHGLALLPTGPQCYFGPSYDHGVPRLPYDPERARELLAQAGWYDRDGDGVIDKDGQPFEIEMLITSGNKSAEVFGRMYQESLAAIGAKLKLTPLDPAAYFKRVSERDFDAGMSGWSVDAAENDPVQLWHSSAAVPGGSNHSGVQDPRVDALILQGQRELDDEKRWALWRELHRYLYEEVQPYLYREAPPRKFALNKSIRGVQFFKLAPGYALRRWYYPAGTSGTRSTREPEPARR